jgi:hypothetical protein
MNVESQILWGTNYENVLYYDRFHVRHGRGRASPCGDSPAPGSRQVAQPSWRDRQRGSIEARLPARGLNARYFTPAALGRSRAAGLPGLGRRRQRVSVRAGYAIHELLRRQLLPRLAVREQQAVARGVGRVAVDRDRSQATERSTSRWALRGLLFEYVPGQEPDGSVDDARHVRSCNGCHVSVERGHHRLGGIRRAARSRVRLQPGHRALRTGDAGRAGGHQPGRVTGELRRFMDCDRDSHAIGGIVYGERRDAGSDWRRRRWHARGLFPEHRVHRR